MHCNICGISLPANGVICPNCGPFTPLYYNQSGSSPNSPTAASSSRPGQQLVSSTNYGSDSSNASAREVSPHLPDTLMSPYPANSYQVTPPPPPYQVTPPPPHTPLSKKGSRRGIIIAALVVLVILLVLAGPIAALWLPINPSGRTGAKPTSRSTQIQATPDPDQVAATATATAARNPYSPYTGTLVLNDPLRDTTAGYQWSEGKQPGHATCSFQGGSYHLQLASKGYDYCGPQANGLVFSNFAFEANVTLIQGDYAGIWFRFDKTQKTRYLFVCSTDGLCLFATDDNDMVTPLTNNRPVALRPSPQTNLLAVVAVNNMISLYVNNHFITSVQNSSYQQGQIGIFGQGINNGFNVIVSDVRVWKL